jgi:GrxC family glutaredoxin
MPKIEIYSKGFCPYCKMAKALFDSIGQSYEEIDLDAQPERIEEMLKRTGGRTTVPEIFIDDELIGGYDALSALHSSGDLAAKLGPA